MHKNLRHPVHLNKTLKKFSTCLGEEREGGEGELYEGQEGGQGGGSCSCESCQERSALVAEMAEETKKLQQCWLQLRQVSLRPSGSLRTSSEIACIREIGSVS